MTTSAGGATSLPPRPADANLQLGFLTSLEKLLGVLSDPKRLAARVAELRAALEESEKSLERAQQAWRDTNELKAQHDRTIAIERNNFDGQIHDEKKAWDAEEARRREAVLKDEGIVAKLKEEAKRDAAAAAKLKADYEGRLRRIEAAAAA